MKQAYVARIRELRALAAKAGLLSALDRRSHGSRSALWLRSLFAIHDIEDMAALDLPWWNMAATFEADSFLRSRPSARVFEYGSGASTIWLARRAGSVTSIEHDRSWHAVVAQRVAAFPNAQLRLIEADPHIFPDYVSMKSGWRGVSFRAYASAIDGEDGLFDLIVIDGRARSACLTHARSRLAPGGMILFDNSGRKRYRRAIKRSGLSVRTFRGLTACLPYREETSLLVSM